MPISWPFSQSQRKIGSARKHKFALFERSEFSKFMRSDSFPSPDFDDFPRRRVGQRWASLPARILAQQRSTPSTRLRPSGSPCGAFSHASCYPIVFALWARLLDSSAAVNASHSPSPFGLALWGVFACELLPNRLRPLGSPLGQLSKKSRVPHLPMRTRPSILLYQSSVMILCFST